MLLCPVFRVNGSLGKGKRRLMSTLITFVNLQIALCFMPITQVVYRRSLIAAISDEAWDRLEDQNGFANGFPLHSKYSRKFRFKKSRVYLLKFNFQADWEDQR